MQVPQPTWVLQGLLIVGHWRLKFACPSRLHRILEATFFVFDPQVCPTFRLPLSHPTRAAQTRTFSVAHRRETPHPKCIGCLRMLVCHRHPPQLMMYCAIPCVHINALILFEILRYCCPCEIYGDPFEMLRSRECHLPLDSNKSQQEYT